MTTTADHVEARERIFLYAILAVSIAIAVWMASFVPNADWYGTYNSAGRFVVQGRSPYEEPNYMNPPWTVLLILPFILFPPAIARGLLLVGNLASLIYIAWRLHSPKAALIALMLSPTAVGSFLAGNLDLLVLLGLFLSPVWGLFFLLIKPQIGVGVALYYMTEAWRNNKIVGILHSFTPVILGYAICAILFLIWVDRMISQPANMWNRKFFHYSIPIGLFCGWRLENEMCFLPWLPRCFSPPI